MNNPRNFQSPLQHKYHGDDRKNLIVFMITVFVLFALYDIFIKQPYIDTLRDEQAQIEAAEAEAMPEVEAVETGPFPRERVLAETGSRLRIETPELTGSIALKGGRIDDLVLTQYFETLEREKNVVLFSPSQSYEPHYGELGWISDSRDIKLPGRMSEWSIRSSEGDEISEVVLGPDSSVTLYWENGEGLTFEREISVDDHYMFEINQRVINETDTDLTLFPYALVARHGLPSDMENAFILHEGPIGYFDKELHEHKFKDIAKKGEESQIATGGWIGFTQKYWFAGVVPAQDMQSKFRFLARPGEERTFFQTDVMGPAMTVEAGTEMSYESHIFAGAKKVRQLDAYEKAFNIPHFDLVVDFGMFYFLTKPFFYVLTWLSQTIGSFAIGLLVFTVLIRLLLFPLANKSYRSFAKLRLIAPKMKELQDRYQDDREGMQKALFDLYKKEQVNPAAGCFPILLQMPIFFALYKVLYVTIETRHTPFFGWINDMSAPDPTSLFNFFGVLPFEPWSFLMIGAWPCLMCLTLLLQQQLSPPPTDAMQKQIMLMMPFVMTIILAGFPAGLVIYWTWSNTLSVVQQIVLMKMMGVDVHLFRFFESDEKKAERAAKEALEAKAEDVTDEASVEEETPKQEETPKDITPPKRRPKKKK